MLTHPIGVFKTWFPKKHARYEECQKGHLHRNPSLHPPSDSTFCAITVNLGPQSVTKFHKDGGDFGTGIGGNTALGPFDGKKGGHLVLHEAKLVVQLLPGETLLFPTAMFTHENIGIGAEEERFSLATYTPGGMRSVFWKAPPSISLMPWL